MNNHVKGSTGKQGLYVASLDVNLVNYPQAKRKFILEIVYMFSCTESIFKPLDDYNETRFNIPISLGVYQEELKKRIVIA